MTPSQLASYVWAVGGSEGAHASGAADCTQYLVWDDGHGFLIDAGTGLGSDKVAENISVITGDSGSVRDLFVTHYHVDHAGGAALAAQRGVTISGSSETASALQGADAAAVELDRAQAAGLYPSDYQLKAVEHVRSLGDGVTLRVGRFVIQAIATPGHCAGHLCFLVTMPDRSNALFSGDHVFSDGSISLQPLWDAHPMRYAESMQRLAENSFDNLFPGHGPAAVGGAREIVTSAAACFAALRMPPNRVACSTVAQRG